MPSYKRERDLAVSTLKRAAAAGHICAGCIGEEFAKCVYEDGPGEGVRCDTCGQCMCSSCHNQSNWTWAGMPASDMAPVVRCRECKNEGLITCPITYIERQAMVFIAHDPDWYCADGARKEDGDERRS